MSGTIDDDEIHVWLSDIASKAWCSLHYETPATAGTGRGEISGGGYLRQKMTFSKPASRTIWCTEDIKFSGLNANRITHFGIWTAQKGGRIRAWGKLPLGGVLVTQGGGYFLPAGKIAISLR